MKVIQFVYPMFLVALGLHASILFVPIGPDEADSALIEEDVPLASITEAPQLPKPSALPVPDPNVTTGTAQIQAAPPALFKPAKVATRPVPPPTAVTIRTAPAPQPATRSTGTSAGTNTSNTASSNTGNNSSGDTGDRATNSASGTTSTPTPATTTPPVPNAPTNNNSVSIEDSPSLSRLVASAQTDASALLVALLEDLSDGLTYRPDNTDEAIAQQNLKAWKASFSQQANAAQIKNIEPISVTDIELTYPIESAKMMDGGSLSVCLDEPPNNAQVGLLFDASGELAENPMLIRSTGYDALNLEVSALITEADNLPNNRASKAYLYDVAVDYDAETCVSLKELKK